MSDENQFKPGDLVQLKSGGPQMTYEGETPTRGRAVCTWFEGKKMQRQEFLHETLKKAPPRAPAAFVVSLGS